MCCASDPTLNVVWIRFQAHLQSCSSLPAGSNLLKGSDLSAAGAEQRYAAGFATAISLEKRAEPDEALPQLRRIVCRMLADLIQPWIWRTGTQLPWCWCPDLLSANGRRAINNPAIWMPAQCDIGFSPSKPVTWGDVLDIVPCMGDDSRLRIIEEVIRDKGHLLPDDTLQHVNRGPWLAIPFRLEDGSQPPCYSRPLHCTMRQPGLPTSIENRIAMRAPNLANCSADQQQENQAALRQLFDPSELANRLEVHSDGWRSMQYWAPCDSPAQPEVAAVYNQMLARTKVIDFLQEAQRTAPFRSKLQLISPSGSWTWALLDRELGSARAFVNSLMAKWVKIPICSHSQITRQRQARTKFHEHGYQLVFLPLQPLFASQSGFLRSLLSPDRACFVGGGYPRIEDFWRSPPTHLT